MNPKIVNFLRELYYYYGRSRGSGHTALLNEGMKNYGKKYILVALNIMSGKQIVQNDRSCLVVTPEGERFQGLSGSETLPVAIDNGAMMTILEDTLTVIQHQQTTISNQAEIIEGLSSKHFKAYLEDVKNGTE